MKKVSIIPKSDRELEQFYRDTLLKTGGTTTTLADEEQKSSIPLIGLFHASQRRVEALEKGNRQLMAAFKQLERRIKNIEGEL